MTSTESAFVSSVVERVRSQAPYEIHGDLNNGDLELRNFPVVEQKDRWVFNMILEDVYRYCEQRGFRARAIRFKDAQGEVVVEVRFPF